MSAESKPHDRNYPPPQTPAASLRSREAEGAGFRRFHKENCFLHSDRFPLPMKPLLFQAFIGGYCGSSFEVKLLEDGRLAYSVSEGGKEASSEILSINDSSWAELRIVLEHARVRDWEGNL